MSLRVNQKVVVVAVVAFGHLVAFADRGSIFGFADVGDVAVVAVVGGGIRE